MSLSPILSIIRDFLIVVGVVLCCVCVLIAGSEFEGFKLRDICRDVGATLLLSTLLGFLLVMCEVPFSFLDMVFGVGVMLFDNVGLANLEFGITNDFGVEEVGVFFTPLVLIALACRTKQSRKQNNRVLCP